MSRAFLLLRALQNRCKQVLLDSPFSEPLIGKRGSALSWYSAKASYARSMIELRANADKGARCWRDAAPSPFCI